MSYYGTEVKRLLPIVAVAAVLVAGGGAFLVARSPSPEQVVTRLLRARYVNDAQAVYELASAADRRARTLEQHLQSHPPFPDDFQELIGELARFIAFDAFDSDLQAAGGTVTARGSVPDANHPEIDRLLYGTGDAATLSLRARRAELRRRGRAGTLPLVEFAEQVELVREKSPRSLRDLEDHENEARGIARWPPFSDQERWTVYLDWAVGSTIHFRAEVREQLPFEFSVEPASITLKPGETGAAVFRARNVSAATVKAKAGHLFDPPLAFLHTELVQCFCFFEDTYAPGEERQLPVAIRLGWDVPIDLGEITMLYEYYPLEQFQDRRPAQPADG